MPNAFTATGNVPAGGTQVDMLWLPDGYQRDGSRRGVVYCHGANEIAVSPLSGAIGGKAAMSALVQQVAAVYPLISIDTGIYTDAVTNSFNNWGNAYGVARTVEAVARLQSPTGGGAKTGTVMLLAESMGHVLAMNYAQANAAKVGCIAGWIPVCDLDQIRDAYEPLGNHSISGAWGTGPWTSPGTPPLPANANPAKPANYSNVVAIPHRMYYAVDDTVAVPQAVLALKAGLGAACSVYNIGYGGHGATGSVPVVDLLNFLAPYG